MKEMIQKNNIGQKLRGKERKSVKKGINEDKIFNFSQFNYKTSLFKIIATKYLVIIQFMHK